MVYPQTIDLVAAGQILGLLLSAVGIYVFYAKTRRAILISKLVCDIGYCIQQIMLAAPTGALIQGIAAFRETVFYHRSSKKWASYRFWLYLFVVLMGVSPILTWAGPISLLPAIGSIVAVFAFYCEQPYHTRILGLLATIPWFIYSILMTNYGIALTTGFQIVSAVLGLVRDYREMHTAKSKHA